MSEVEGEKRTNKLSASPDLFNETEPQRWVDAFWKIYDKYQDERLRKPYLSMYMAYYLF